MVQMMTNMQFYENLFQKISDIENENVIVCEDWNSVLNPDVDSEKYRNINNLRDRDIVLNSVEQNSFIDIWRLVNDDNKRLHMAKKKSWKKAIKAGHFFW